LRKKAYGNVAAEEYIEWFVAFAHEFRRVLKPEGSLVVDIGGTWVRGTPVRSLYHFELVLRLCKPVEASGCGFNLAQELYWYNPAKLPTPAEWVTVRRVRVKDAVNTVWWMSPSENPKANNRRVLKPYSESQKVLMKNGYKPKLRPSEHNISHKFGVDNGGAIPPNLIGPRNGSVEGYEIGEPVPLIVAPEWENEADAITAVNLIAASNTSSNDTYQTRCREAGITPHPARFPSALPEFVIGLCTEEGDLVLDPFAGSNTTGFVAERMGRRWIAMELTEEYLIGSRFRFEAPARADQDGAEAGAGMKPHQPVLFESATQYSDIGKREE
jgi:site-specific DNA-methyltransferase (cytosine-N4-specific)